MDEVIVREVGDGGFDFFEYEKLLFPSEAVEDGVVKLGQRDRGDDYRGTRIANVLDEAFVIRL